MIRNSFYSFVKQILRLPKYGEPTVGLRSMSEEIRLNGIQLKHVCVYSILITVIFLSAGCHWFPRKQKKSELITNSSHYHWASTQIEYPELEQTVATDSLVNTSPVTLRTDPSQIAYWELGLEEVVQLGLKNTKILRDLGGVILRTPDNVDSTFDPAIQETDPRFGVQAALSAFDTSFAASAFYESNDRALNNVFFGGGTRLLEQQAAVFQGQLSKQSATGTEYIIRHIFDYDRNNAPGNAFPNAWNVMFEGEFRQPLLKGLGVDYWRTVGNSDVPGVYNGVLIARTSTDVSLAEFEIGVRNYITNLENAYWDLYFAYRDLDTKIAARDYSLELWRRVKALNDLGRAGGEADKEAQAREQYFRFEEDLQNAFNGIPSSGTRTYDGSPGGAFKASGGVVNAERRLRYLIGMPINDGRMIRPQDEPLAAPVDFDWDLSLSESLSQRPELRRQKWMVKRRELELQASQKLLLPELDLVGLYRFRGFGEQLLRPDSDGRARFDNAWRDLNSGDFQEWQVGVEMNFPLGNRQAHSGVRNAEFQLAKARQVLKEQERSVIHDLSNAIGELDRTASVLKAVNNRYRAAKDQLDAITASYEADQAPINLVLESQRRLASAESRYFSAIVEHHLAVRNVHFEKGTLLEYCGVHLSEGKWPAAAYNDAEEVEKRRSREKKGRFLRGTPQVISQGPMDQQEGRVVIDDHPIHQLPLKTETLDMLEPIPQELPQPAPIEESQKPINVPMLNPPTDVTQMLFERQSSETVNLISDKQTSGGSHSVKLLPSNPTQDSEPTLSDSVQVIWEVAPEAIHQKTPSSEESGWVSVKSAE